MPRPDTFSYSVSAMSLSPVCEFVDRNAGRLHIGVHLRGRDEQPEAQFRLRLRPRWGGPAVT